MWCDVGFSQTLRLRPLFHCKRAAHLVQKDRQEKVIHGWWLFFVCPGFFFVLGVVKFRSKAMLMRRAQQSTAAEAGGRVPGEQGRAAPSRGKHPATEELEERPSSRDRQRAPAAPRCSWTNNRRGKTAALPLPVWKCLAVHCFGLPFLLLKTLSGYEAIQ